MSKVQVVLTMGLALMMGQALIAAPAADEHDRPRPGERAAPRPAAGRPGYDGRGQVLDSRYSHGRYYPPVGAVRSELPAGYRPYFHGSDRFYFSGGVWYAPRGPGFVVVRPPVGLVIGVLPPYYTTVWFGGVPYYYADNTYYTWQPDQNGYAVAEPPPNADPSAPDGAPQDDTASGGMDPNGAAAGGAPPPNGQQMDLIVYPKNGQTKEQQSADQYECHTWAKGQTGFDPTQPAGSTPPAPAANPDMARNNYDRAMSACLQARGYQVN